MTAVLQQHRPAVGGLRIGLCAGLGALARRTPRFAAKSKLFRSVATALLGRRRAAVVPVELSDGTRLLLDPRGRTEARAFYLGKLDSDDLDFFRCCIGPGAVALDIGANIGLVSIPLGRDLRSHGGKLISFEPIAANADRLSANVRINDLEQTVTLVRCALSDSEGQMEMGREVGGGAGTGNAAFRQSAGGLGQPLEWSTVKVRRLDDVINEIGIPRLDFIKIDVEGAEIGVLRGGLETLKRFRPIIYGEFSAGLMPRFNSNFAEVGQLMAPVGYRAMAFSHWLDLMDVPYEAGRGNAVLCPTEKAQELLARCATARGKWRRTI
jgi:FkbM family methyltransferase